MFIAWPGPGPFVARISPRCGVLTWRRAGPGLRAAGWPRNSSSFLSSPHPLLGPAGTVHAAGFRLQSQTRSVFYDFWFIYVLFLFCVWFYWPMTLCFWPCGTFSFLVLMCLCWLFLSTNVSGCRELGLICVFGGQNYFIMLFLCCGKKKYLSLLELHLFLTKYNIFP